LSKKQYKKNKKNYPIQEGSLLHFCFLAMQVLELMLHAADSAEPL
jgi:hypothetical protein